MAPKVGNEMLGSITHLFDQRLLGRAGNNLRGSSALRTAVTSALLDYLSVIRLQLYLQNSSTKTLPDQVSILPTAKHRLNRPLDQHQDQI